MLWVQMSGVKSGAGSGKGVKVETVPGGLSKIPSLAGIMPGEGKIEESG